MGVDAEYRHVVTAPRAIAVVGAGPAGLFAAEVLATAGHRVTVIDRMPAPARKFLLAGRGGLNLTHSEPLEQFLTRYGDGGASRVRGAIRAFPPAQLIAWAEGLGETTFVGSSGRVFPQAMKASPLLRAWLRRLESLGVTLKTRQTWIGFSDVGGGAPGLRIAGDGVEWVLRPDAVILALGGASWSRLGSDGSWVTPLRDAGVDIEPLAPSNCGVAVTWTEHFAARFAGQPLKRIAVRAGDVERRGEAVITRNGLEGGVLYALGPAIRAALRDGTGATLAIDLRPDVGAAVLAERLARPRNGQSVSTFLRKTLRLDPQAIGLLRESGLPADAVGRAQRMKSIVVPITGLAGTARAISTAGGVSLSAIDSNWMLKAQPGVFAAGEMLDWDAPTGGYLLQAAFATGRAAAEGALAWLDSRTKA